MKEVFVERKFQAASLDLIEKAEVILDEYHEQGLILTLRQLYYQFVARGFLPNKQQEYKRLGSVINDARLAGMIDWGMMEDRTRQLEKLAAWGSPTEIIEAISEQYRTDIWAGQKWRPEVWIEKDALVGVIERPCNSLRVPYFACRGYTSQSAQYEAGCRFRSCRAKGQTPIVFHFGDHDPSGIDMTRDNEDRLLMFTHFGVEVQRLALTMDQIRHYNPPPNPAKETDSRSDDYIRKYGSQSWELDALEPSVIGTLIHEAVEPLIDRKAWNKTMKTEKEDRATLAEIATSYDDVKAWLDR